VRLPGRDPLRRRLHGLGVLRREREPRPPAASCRRAFTVTWTNLENGKSISSVLGGPVVNEFAADGTLTQIVAGRERLFIARGEGPIAKQVGRIVFVVAPDGTETVASVAGQWDLDITPELCAYLA